MKKKISLFAIGLLLSFFSMKAQTSCANDTVEYVNSKNVGLTGAYTLAIGTEEKASQAYHYSGPGRVAGARVYGTVPSSFGTTLRVSLYNVDGNDRPTGAALSTSAVIPFFVLGPDHFDVNFSPPVSVSANFAIVVEVVHTAGWGHEFALKYTGNGEGLGEDLASLAGTSTGFNWASAMTTFGKDGDFYINPRMINYNTPMFEVSSSCISAGGSVTFSNGTEMTVAPMFNLIAAPGYSGANHLYTWDFGDGSGFSFVSSPTHTYTTPGSYTITLTSKIQGWDGVCAKTYTKRISVGLVASTTSIANVTCNGGANGSVTGVATGGASPYTYSINGSDYFSSATFTGLTAGTRVMYVKDAVGCIQTVNFTINQPAAITFTSTSSTNASCGNSDGSLLVATSGGVAPIQYQLNSGTFQASGAFGGLSSGAYNITARDANGCTATAIVVVNDVGGPTWGVTNYTHVSCYGGHDGSISLSSLGGTGAIQYSIDGGATFTSSATFTGLAAGTYVEVVKDATGCTDIQVVTIRQPQPIAVTASATPLTCFESGDGQINVTSVTGGTGVVSYSIDGTFYQSSTNFSGLSAGTYTLYTKDVAGCLNTISVTVTQPTALTASVSTTNAGCYKYSDGSITIVGSGGTPGYTYGFGDGGEGQSNGVFTDLAAGTYSIFVTDKNGCTYYTTATISEPSLIVPVATTTNSTCGNSNGGILVTASGGAGSGYTYSKDGGAFGAGSFTSLPSGTYVITARDAAGCMATVIVTILDSDGPVIGSSSHTNVSCNGGNDGTITIGSVTGGTGTLLYSVDGVTYQLSPTFTNLTAGTYIVRVKDAVGCIGSITITITQPFAFVITSSVVNEVCHAGGTASATVLVGGGSGTLAYSINGGSTFQSSNTFNGLTAGDYVIIVRDAGGCLGYTAVTITEPAAITATFTSLNVTCHGAHDGAINVTARGGTGILRYSLNGGTYQTSRTFSGLAGGAYTVYVKDANNCVIVIAAMVYEPAVLTSSASIGDVSCAGGNNGVIDLSVSGGTVPYSFSWSNEVTSEDNFYLSAGTYAVLVTDNNGCTTTSSYTITQPATPVIVNGTVVTSTASNGQIDITVTGGVGGYSYTWSNGSHEQDLTNLDPGTYTVVVTDNNGCAASSTFVVDGFVGITSIENVNAAVNVYPNPATEFAVVELKGFKMDKLEVYDVMGQLMLSTTPRDSKTEINTSTYGDGVYFIKIQVGENLVTKKLRVIK